MKKRIKNNITILALLTMISMISKLAIQNMLALTASWNLMKFIELFILFYMYIRIVVKIK